VTPERWKKVEELFDEALEHSPAERLAFVSAACAGDEALRHQVETLIKSYEAAGSFIEEPVLGNVLSSGTEAEGSTSWIGRRIGSYRLAREIGRGGMGAVFLAVRADDEYQKRVAIKLVKRGMDTDFILRRFRQERQILASLDHPHIARLLDGGTTDDGLPYFVMEYIEGLPITIYCDGQRLSTTERLTLFLKVCAAVQHAHHNLVIHRDLKPSNVLVTPDGTPKLLDFGIAKLLNPEMGSQTLDPTTVAMRLMTPEYASPEQVRGEIVTMASDVYSLGVLLYELTTGHRPYRLKTRSPDELGRIICEEEPERPSVVINLIEVIPSRGPEPAEITPENVIRARGESLEKLRRQLTGGIDNIILKALRKEPHRRYQSSDEFAADIQRFLDGLPVLAPSFFPVAADSKPEISETPTGPKSIAILPFKTLRAEDAADEYLGMGMADALITKLSNIRRIVVRPTSSIIKYFDGEQNAVVAGHELDVDYVLDGRVQRVAGRVRVTVQLVRVRDGAPLWAEKFDEKFTDMFTVEDSISEQLAKALMLKVSGEEINLLRKRDTENPSAYQAYLRGRFFWNKFTEEGFARALDHFKDAITLDPGYALAYVGLADYLNWAAVYGMGAPRDLFPQAKAAALKALELDDTLAEAHAALAFTTLCYEWDARTAEQQFKLAIEINPNYSLAHQWYSNLLIAQGRFDEGIAEVTRAQELNPLSLMDKSITGWSYYHARQYERARNELNRVLEMDRNFGNANMMLGTVLERLGEYDRAIAVLRRSLEGMDGSIVPLWILGYTLAKAGRRAEANEIITKLVRLSDKAYVPPYFIAMIYAGLGDRDLAFEWLEKAFENRDAWLIWIGTEPKMDELNSDPRYSELLRRVGIQSSGPVSVSSDGHDYRHRFFVDTEKVPPAVSPVRKTESKGEEDSGRFESIPSPEPRHVADAFMKSSPHLPRVEARRTRWLWPVVIAALIMVASISGAFLFLKPRAHLAPFDNVKSSRLTITGTAIVSAVSPDGKFVAYTLEEAGKQSLWGRQTTVSNAIRLLQPTDVDYKGLAFSKDGGTIYYVTSDKNNRNTLNSIPAIGGAGRKLAENVDSPVGVSPDGKQLAFVRTDSSRGEDALIVSSISGEDQHKVAFRKFPEHFSVSSAPAWMPDGKNITVVVETSDESGFYMKAVKVALDSGKQEDLLAERWLEIGQTAWLADASGLIMSAQDANSNFLQLVYVSFPDGKSRKITSDISDYKSPAVPTDSRSIVTVKRETLTNIWISPPRTPDRTTQLTAGAGRYFDISWSADGKILYASDANGSADIWQLEPDGTNQKQITTGGGRNYGPAASPDGRYILFHSNRSGTWQIWRMDRDGSNQIQITKGKEQSNWPAVSPDGRWIVYEHVGEGTLATLWRIPIDGGTPLRLTSEISMRPAISPDGKTIAYWQKDQKPGADWKIGLTPFDGSGPTRTFDVPQSPTPGNTSLRWTQDGTAIIYMDYRDGVTSFWLQPVNGDAPKKLTEVANNQIYAFDVGRDGRFIFSRGLRSNDVMLISDIH
jgi:serine/threonine protein kinase/Tol biopolymer transport system component/tetratricopeptide (TPR) repeat protein